MNNKKWAVFDTESDSFDGLPVEGFIWGFLDSDDNYFYTYSKQEFITHIQNFEGICYAHNGSKFDTIMLSEFFNVPQPI